MNDRQLCHCIRTALQNEGARNRAQEARLVSGIVSHTTYYDWTAGVQTIRLDLLVKLLERVGMELMLKVKTKK